MLKYIVFILLAIYLIDPGTIQVWITRVHLYGDICHTFIRKCFIDLPKVEKTCRQTAKPNNKKKVEKVTVMNA